MKRNIILWMLLLGGVYSFARADALDDAINGVSSETTVAAQEADALNKDVADILNKYRLTNAEACPLLIIGMSSATSVSISFIPGVAPVAVLNADIVSDAGINFSSVTAGPASIAAGKGVESNVITPSDIRFIDFGINQNVLGIGILANVAFDTSKASAGAHIFTLTNVTAADPNGNDIPICATTGVITK